MNRLSPENKRPRRNVASLNIGLGLTAAVLFLIAGMSQAAISGEEKVAHFDDFEEAKLDTSFWSLRRISEKRYWIVRGSQARSGEGALALRVKGPDYDPACKCQQKEVRETLARRLNFGDDAWYGFSFKLEGSGARTGPSRWVVGGWKQESNGSAFVAQRYDKGVFHITLESGSTRVLLASAEGEAASFLDRLALGLANQFNFVADVKRYEGETDLKIEYGKNAILPDPAKEWVDMVYHIKGGLNGDGLVEVYANGRFIARAQGTIGVHDFDGRTQYFKAGHNRAPMSGTATFYLDNFSRAPARHLLRSGNEKS